MVELFNDARLNRDIAEEGLKCGDVVVPLDYFSSKTGNDSYTIEVFNAVGQTILVTAVSASALEPITANDVPQVRPGALTMKPAG